MTMMNSTGRKRLLALIFILIAGAALYLGGFGYSYLLPRCLVKTLTGWSCPGCGLQRAVGALLHGDWRAAYAYNRFLFLLSPYLAALLAVWLAPWGKRKARCRRLLTHPVLLVLLFVATMLWMVVRNLYGI